MNHKHLMFAAGLLLTISGTMYCCGKCGSKQHKNHQMKILRKCIAQAQKRKGRPLDRQEFEQEKKKCLMLLKTSKKSH